MSDKTPPTHKRMFFREAIAKAVREEMRASDKVFILGQDVGAFGGSYREFDGLFTEFGPDRVRDTPVAENAQVGIGVGAAAAGYRPIVSITYMDFTMLGFDPLINYGAKLRFYPTGAVTLQASGGTAIVLPGLTYVAGDQLQVRVQVVGTSPTIIRAKVWRVGETEPAAWQVSVTDNTTAALQGPGGVALQVYLPTSATNAKVSGSTSTGRPASHVANSRSPHGSGAVLAELDDPNGELVPMTVELNSSGRFARSRCDGVSSTAAR